MTPCSGASVRYTHRFNIEIVTHKSYKILFVFWCHSLVS